MATVVIFVSLIVLLNNIHTCTCSGTLCITLNFNMFNLDLHHNRAKILPKMVLNNKL
jgi:hypothetical protein